MLTPSCATRIFLASQPVDFRKGFDGLSAFVTSSGLDLYSGHLFVFLSADASRVKILCWEQTGLVLYYKRLVNRRFRWPVRSPGAQTVSLDPSQLACLLEGIETRSTRRSAPWSPPSSVIQNPSL